jgi:hypothetical protein
MKNPAASGLLAAGGQLTGLAVFWLFPHKLEGNRAHFNQRFIPRIKL